VLEKPPIIEGIANVNNIAARFSILGAESENNKNIVPINTDISPINVDKYLSMVPLFLSNFTTTTIDSYFFI